MKTRNNHNYWEVSAQPSSITRPKITMIFWRKLSRILQIWRRITRSCRNWILMKWISWNNSRVTCSRKRWDCNKHASCSTAELRILKAMLDLNDHFEYILRFNINFNCIRLNGKWNCNDGIKLKIIKISYIILLISYFFESSIIAFDPNAIESHIIIHSLLDLCCSVQIAQFTSLRLFVVFAYP